MGTISEGAFMGSISEALGLWLTTSSLGKKPKTKKFYREVHGLMLRAFPNPDLPVSQITAEIVLEVGTTLAPQCPSRWNTFVSAIRGITPHGKVVSRRAANLREFTPPNQLQFDAFLKECDDMKRTKAGLSVRFLCLSGMRISEAMALKWTNVFPDRIEAPAATAKNGKARSIPLLPGMADVLARLKAISKDEYVLPQKSPRKAIEVASRAAFGVQWSFHCCRHFFATRCIQSGVDIPTVARWLGHSDGGALASKTYFHLVGEHSQRMAAKVNIIHPGPSQSPPKPQDATPRAASLDATAQLPSPPMVYQLSALTQFQIVNA